MKSSCSSYSIPDNNGRRASLSLQQVANVTTHSDLKELLSWEKARKEIQRAVELEKVQKKQNARGMEHLPYKEKLASKEPPWTYWQR